MMTWFADLKKIARYGVPVLAGVICVAGFSTVGQAQFNNKPYSFNTPTGAPGMSTAARQAIINDQLYDSRPQNMMRDSSGALLSIEKSKGGTAIVRTADGEVLPGFRGTSISVGGMSVGVFNAYFMAADSGRWYAPVQSMAATYTINGWINLLSQDGRTVIPPVTASPVDGWTWMAAGF
ncbi:hypothetical protein [Thalassospira mesophila]|uniref:Uncharacterized protein n=1 Tax=Thalassospira mesophila TaxID=1293891 RepID=A0A1Y2L1L4_9PROT|nr:hypothetical protein [Thalassospira mesophila]OSQ39361.1 hypothetical protein TMES_04600 [Thalassospira mesophila]